MLIKRFYIIWSLLLGGLWGTGCAADQELLPKQKEQFVNYLGRAHNPRLLSEKEVSESLDEEPPFYTVAGNSVYRFISNYYDVGREEANIVEYGDLVTVTFSQYVFAFQNIGVRDMPYFSNDAALEQAFIEAGLTPGVSIFEPLKLELGAASLIKGFELALLGSREGDVVEAYMTYTMAYGSDIMNVIPKDSPIAIFFTVDKVVKQ